MMFAEEVKGQMSKQFFTRQGLKAFILGSSLCITVFPLAGLAIATAGLSLSPGEIQWSMIAIVFPVLLGVANFLTVTLTIQRSLLSMILIGAIIGIVLSSYGVFVLNYPQKVYGLQGNHRYLVLAVAPVFYGMIWAYPMRWINELFGLDERLS